MYLASQHLTILCSMTIALTSFIVICVLQVQVDNIDRPYELQLDRRERGWAAGRLVGSGKTFSEQLSSPSVAFVRLFQISCRTFRGCLSR